MKCAIVTDTHFGARSDSIPFDNFFAKFYDEIFFPHIEREGIKTIIHLGDVFDRRKYVNYHTLKRCKEYFFNNTKKLGIDVIMITGNHDTYFKNTNEVNSLNLLLAEYDNVTVYSDPTEINIDGLNILMMPWICSGNYETSMKMVQNTTAKICFGHFEFAGFAMFKGYINDHGMDALPFKKFDLVCSGHFHHRSSIGNIHYLGNPYEFTWSDFNDPRGYHIFDTKDCSLEFYENTNKLFHRISYDDSSGVATSIPDNLHGSCVKVIVEKKTDFYKYDKFLEKLYAMDLLEPRILEDFSEFEEGQIDEEEIDIEDTMSILTNYVDSVNTDIDKGTLKNVLRTLYIEAQNHTE